MALSLASSIRTLNSVAMGERKADLVLENCSLISVYTGEVIPKTEIAISRDRIAYVGNDAGYAVGPETVTMDLQGKFVCPGFADPHTHIDQFVLPSELAKKSLLCGVTSLFSDPVDIVSVAGYRGFLEFLRLGRGLPMRIFQVVPGGLPVDERFSGSKRLSLSEEKSALKHPDVLGMGEVFSWTKVTAREPKTIKSLCAMLESDCVINGHTAGASGRKLGAYVSSGILSCHEPINFDQVLERLRLGMWIMMREGSIRRDLKNIIPLVLSSKTYTDRLMFCSDGVDPADLAEYGHIDHCVREAVRLGLEPADAITMASKNCFDYYGMGRDLGGIAPGKLADIVTFDDIKSIRPDKVFVGGKLVVSGGKLAVRIGKRRVPAWLKNTIKLKKFGPADFAVKSKAPTVTANTIFMQTEIITKLNAAELQVRDGNVRASAERDVWKVAAIDRIHGTGKATVGFLENFGSQVGAFASTWSLHENDLMVVGTSESDMAVAANSLVASQGGLAVAKDGKVLALMRLEVGGIISTGSLEDTLAGFEGINSCLADSGCRFSRPHLVPLFLPFLALPSVRILSGGMVDVKRRVRIAPLKPRLKKHDRS